MKLALFAFLVPAAATTCMNDFMCPEHSERIPSRSCYNNFDDCQCIPGYYKSGEACVTNLSPGCNKFWDFSKRKDRSCYDTIDDVDCIFGYYKSGDACVTDKSPGCNKFWDYSDRKNRGCYDTISDVDCWPGFKKEGNQCVFNNPWSTVPDPTPTCAFYHCPLNSYPTDSTADCIASFDDCSCLPHYSKSGDMCVCDNTYTCPPHSSRIPGRNCYDMIDDCECEAGYIKDGEACVPGFPLTSAAEWVSS